MSGNLSYYATCAFGLESLVRDELLALGIKDVRASDARIDFIGSMADGAEANMWLRCADRVFFRLGEFPANSFEELFEGIKKTDISAYLPFDAKVYVTGKTALSKLVSVRDIQSIGKKSMAESMMVRYGYQRCPETGETYNIEIGMLRNIATIGLNLSGEGLNRRGYRDLSVKAPIRETLAAGMVMLAHYGGREILLDPFCGSGTIAIEAAMIASHTAPGLHRTFAYQRWPVWGESYRACKERAQDMRRGKGFVHIHASDVEEKMISIVRHHAKRAQVNGFINTRSCDIRELTMPSQQGVIVTNPPYGKRLELNREIIAVLGQKKEQTSGWRMFIISADPAFEKIFGRSAERRRRLYNGNIRCQYYMYLKESNKRRRSDHNSLQDEDIKADSLNIS